MTPARKVRIGVTLVLLLLIGGAATLFTLQNSSRMTDLSLDLYFFATHLQKPVAVPVLVWIAFGSGLVIGGGWGLLGRSRRRAAPAVGGAASARTDFGRADDDDWT